MKKRFLVAMKDEDKDLELECEVQEDGTPVFRDVKNNEGAYLPLTWIGNTLVNLDNVLYVTPYPD